MKIGTFTKNSDNSWVGEIQTLTLRAAAQIIPVEEPGDNEKAPRYTLIVNECDVAPVWIEQSKNNVPYLSIIIDDPSFPEPARCALFKGSDNQYNLIWNRKTTKKASNGAPPSNF